MTESLQPNMIIVNIDNSLISFPLSDDGIISNGTHFESDYSIENSHIVFALFNEDDCSSKELYRFSYMVEDKEEQIKVLWENKELPIFTKYIFDNHIKGDL